jgi:salicylate hydroxylase
VRRNPARLNVSAQAVASSRNIIIAGAGIGGMTAALALAQSGFRVTLLEQAESLTDVGAGIQLSPNATRVLIALGLDQRLRDACIVPTGVAIMAAGGANLAHIPLGKIAEARYGAPYWVIHRSDLQAALLDAVRSHPDISLRLGTRVEDFAVHAHGVSAALGLGTGKAVESGIALVCADGLWSGLRARLGVRDVPQFGGRAAWRALVPAETAEPLFRGENVTLWLGRNAHVVHYPVKAGRLINIVAIVGDDWAKPGWSADGARDELLARFSRWHWADPVRELLGAAQRWTKWALYELPPIRSAIQGPITLLGDAAHPMLPFLAQGAASAIEDAVVLADALARRPHDLSEAMRSYERARRRRTAHMQRAARRQGQIYHLRAGEAFARNLFLRIAGGRMLLRRYDWLYDWRAPPLRAGAVRHLATRAAGEE